MDIKYLYENTDLTQQQIAAALKCPINRVHKWISRNYTRAYRLEKKSICYRNSKLGEKNPMTGKCGELHHMYIGDVSDQKGYLMRVKPTWFTSRKNSRHAFTHHIVVCENLGITGIPKGWSVHHCDFNPLNNSFDNLVLLMSGDHNRLHRHLSGVTTISKESTLKWVETYGTPWSRDDIVSSAQECAAAKAGIA